MLKNSLYKPLYLYFCNALWTTIIIWIIIIGVILFLFRNTIKEKFFTDKTKNYTIDDKYNAAKREREKEIDHLLSKMGKNGIARFKRKRPQKD